MGISPLNDAGGPACRSRFFPPAARPCDYCKSSAALLFCRADAIFMCISCDAKVHDSGNRNKHERVWMCEVCEQAPAVVTCKADAAALCVACDRDIHSANPLASRHDRAPVVPFYDTAETVVMKSTEAAAAAAALLAPEAEVDQQSGYISDSWVSMSPIVQSKNQLQLPVVHNNNHNPDLKAMELLLQDSDQFLDFENYQINSNPYGDSVVPVQTSSKPPVLAGGAGAAAAAARFEIDFAKSTINSFNNGYTTPSLSHSVSSSSMEVGVVPDGSSLSEISYPFPRNMNSSVELSGNQGPQVVRMDRQARVLRYREKRKNRKFEKTIRYASRKAYAETRPRIKGRFAKRTDADSEMDRIFSANFIADSRYGVVPTF